MQTKTYERMTDFEDDLKWFAFYCRANLSKDYKEGAIALLKIVKEEVVSIRDCEECFLNAYHHDAETAFVMPCKLPHLLLWSYWEDYCYWPSKAMYVEDTQNLVNVRFFGDHTTLTMSAEKCYLFSKDRPDSEVNVENIEGFDHAMTVSLNYYLNIIFNVIKLNEHSYYISD